jgi:hypothetical protein
MKRKLFTLIAAAGFALFTTTAFAQGGPPTNPGTCPNCPNGGIPKKDGTGPGAKRGHRGGPQDGSGPMHRGQGQGPGQGRHGGRR